MLLRRIRLFHGIGSGLYRVFQDLRFRRVHFSFIPFHLNFHERSGKVEGREENEDRKATEYSFKPPPQFGLRPESHVLQTDLKLAVSVVRGSARLR